MVFPRFIIDNFFLVSLGRNYLFLTFKKICVVFFMYLLLL